MIIVKEKRGKMKKKKLFISVVMGIIYILTFFILSGCASVPMANQKFNQKRYNESASNADFEKCLGMIESKTGSKDGVPLNLDIDKGLAYHFLNDFDTSADSLYSVDMVLQGGPKGKNYWPSLFEAYTLVAMDALSNYNGADKETSLENAMTRIRRLGEIQTMYDEYRVQIEQLQKEALEKEVETKDGKKVSLGVASAFLGIDLNQIAKMAPPEKKEYERYADSDFARLLSVYIRNEYGDSDNVYDMKLLKNQALKKEAQAAISMPKGKGRVEFFAFNGMLAQQKVNFVEFPGKDKYGRSMSLNCPIYDLSGKIVDNVPISFKFSWPGLDCDSEGKVKSTSRVKRIMITPLMPESTENAVAEGPKETILLEDFNESLRKEVNYEAHDKFMKNMAEIIAAKYVAVVASSVSLNLAYENVQKILNNPIESVLAQLAYTAARDSMISSVNEIDEKNAVSTEQVKILPEKVSCVGFFMDPGEHNFQIDYLGLDGFSLYSETKTVVVEEGKPTIVESFYLK